MVQLDAAQLGEETAEETALRLFELRQKNFEEEVAKVENRFGVLELGASIFPIRLLTLLCFTGQGIEKEGAKNQGRSSP